MTMIMKWPAYFIIWFSFNNNFRFSIKWNSPLIYILFSLSLTFWYFLICSKICKCLFKKLVFYLLKRTVNIVLSWSDPCKSMQLSIHKGTFKLIYRLCKILELKAQYFREKDSFDTNETFLRCTILEKSVKSFVIFHQHGSETFFTII